MRRALDDGTVIEVAPRAGRFVLSVHRPRAATPEQLDLSNLEAGLLMDLLMIEFVQ